MSKGSAEVVFACCFCALAATVSELLFRLAKRDALEQPQEVAGREHGAERCNHHERAEESDRQPCRRLIGRQDRGELTPETGKPGEPERGHRTEPENPAHLRRLDQQATETTDLEGVETFLHRTGDEEQHAGNESVRNHAEHRGVDSVLGEGRDTQHHEAHMGHR